MSKAIWRFPVNESRDLPNAPTPTERNTSSRVSGILLLGHTKPCKSQGTQTACGACGHVRSTYSSDEDDFDF